MSYTSIEVGKKVGEIIQWMNLSANWPKDSQAQNPTNSTKSFQIELCTEY